MSDKRGRQLAAPSVGTGAAWNISIGTTLQMVLDSPKCHPLLRRALTGALPWQARNRISVARALKAARLAPQWIAALLAVGATVTVESDAGSEEVPLESALRGEVDGDVTTLHIPLEDDLRWGEARVARTRADEPIVAAVAAVRLNDGVVEGARVALTGVWPEAVRLAEAPAQLIGGPLDERRIQDVAGAVEVEVTPRGDYLGSDEYRRAMAGVLTRRALEACLR